MKYLRPHLASLLITPSVNVAISHLVCQYKTLLDALKLFSQYWFEQIREQSSVFLFRLFSTTISCFRKRLQISRFIQSEDHRMRLAPRFSCIAWGENGGLCEVTKIKDLCLKIKLTTIIL